MVVFGGSVCQRPHNCVSEERRQIAGGLRSSGFYRMCPVSLSAQPTSWCLHSWVYSTAFLGFMWPLFSKKRFCGRHSINSTLTEQAAAAGPEEHLSLCPFCHDVDPVLLCWSVHKSAYYINTWFIHVSLLFKPVLLQ